MSDDLPKGNSSGSFSFKRPGKKKLRTPFKKNNKAREASAAIKKQSLDEYHQRQQLFDIEESQSQPTSPATARKAVVGDETSSLDADNAAFLKAMRGGSAIDEDEDSTSVQEQQPWIISNNASLEDTSYDGGKRDAAATRTQQAKANNDFLTALRAESNEPSSNAVNTTRQSYPSSSVKASKTSALSEADHSFLANLHGTVAAQTAASSPAKKQQQQQTYSISTNTSSFSDADHDFLAQVHGAQQQHISISPPTTPPISPPRVRTFTGEGSPTKMSQKQHESQQRESSASLSSMDTSPSFQSRARPSSRWGKANNTNSTDLANTNAAFLGALHASVDDDQGDKQQQQQSAIATDGSFIMDSTPNIDRKQHSKNSTSEADAAFLKDIHLGESYSSQGQFSAGSNAKTDYSSGTQDAGTFVFKGPSPSKASESSSSQEPDTFVFKGANTPKDSNAAFMMAIHASEDSDAGVESMEGANDDADNSDALLGDDAVDLEDEEIEGLTVPSQPYIEKVLLPRPLFFGSVLAPRITEEAKHAATLCEVSYDLRLTDSKSDIGDQDDTSSVSSNSKLSLSSFGGVGKHDLEPIIAPCSRNLEGAIETFGFGINPFAINDGKEKAVDDSVEPMAPHPYVSLYSPVWEDWARTARVKARRQKAKLMNKSSSRSSSVSATPAKMNTITSRRQSTAKATSNDFGDRPSKRETGRSSLESSVTSVTASLDFSHDDVEQVASARPQDSSSDDRDFSRDQFLKFARAGFADNNDGDSFDSEKDRKAGRSSGAAPTMSQIDGGTFVQMENNIFVDAVNNTDDASDDNSVEATEERKSVGLNDNISAAAAMLAGEGADDVDDDTQGGVRTSMFMAVGGGAKAANKYGRPYTNFELTNGCIPQFGCDDPSLPHESDLGAFQTKEEEKRSADERRERNIIEDSAVPGIMPHIACPTHCTDVDDSQSWNARFSGGKLGIKGGPNTVLISLDDNTSTDGESLSSGKRKQPLVYETSRVGWWNLPVGLGEDNSIQTSKRRKSRSKIVPKMEVFPAFDDPIPLDVQTHLWPPPSLLRENNFSSTRLHPATAAARSLPHLSDRPACMRHIQIDTTAVGFPKLGGEIEPMFCRLAIYHFEMKSITSPTGKTSFAPNMTRCGPVTEALNFDIVQDPSVIQNCKRALWPYEDDSTALEGTSCGVFSLPSNLSLSNLYAVLIVNKVIARSSDLEHYYKPNRRESKASSGAIEQLDLEKLRENAAKASEESGQFITPFVFGIVPLLHIIETESTKTPVSRAVQIPLFKFAQGRGMESILDHILVMLHPSSEPKIAKAAPLTRGHALLVTRYFGYLGMHSIIDKKSSLSRERLVDFTCELQVKCEDDAADTTDKKVKCPVLGESYVLPPWRPHYKTEPAICGGRSAAFPVVGDDLKEKETPQSSYAQELAALPLENPVAEGYGNMSSHAGKYDGLQIHTSFCNELICQPRMLQGCSNGSIVVKVELRKLEWSSALNAEVAVPVAPSIHNTRRGTWLVEEAFTSCAMDVAEPRFLDEFKVKLPLIMGQNNQEKLGLFFSVYNVNVRTKRRPSVFSKRGTAGCDDVAHIGSGFLSLTRDDCSTCLIENGGYEVPITLRAVELFNVSPGQHKKVSSFGGNIREHIRSLSRSSDILDDEDDEVDIIAHQQAVHDYPVGTLALSQLRSRSYQEQEDIDDNDTTGSKDHISTCSAYTPPRRHVSSKSEDLRTISSEKSDSYDESDRKSNPLESLAKGLRSVSSHGNLQQLMSPKSPKSDCTSSTENEMVLHVNILAVSSVHPQNKTLADLFQMKPKLPRPVVSSDFSDQYYAPWGKQRSEILYRLQPERIPPFHFVGGALAEMERKILTPVVNLSKGSKCSPTDVMPHLIRVVGQLYRVAVTGTGEPSILWASPDSLIPLRLNAFAALLRVISSVSDHMTNAGLRQLDGNSKWNLLALGKVLSMLFDEGSILGGTLEDLPIDETETFTATKKPDIISQRSQTLDNAVSTKGRPQLISRYSSNPEDDSPRQFDIDAMLQPNCAPKGGDTDSNEFPPLTSKSSGFTVDSKGAFMSALAASLDGDDSSNSSAISTGESSPRASLLPPRPAASRRRWMTLPTNALATIQESSDDDGRTGSDLLSSSLTKPSSDPLDGELILNGDKKKPMQMRVPVVETEKNKEDSINSVLDELSLQATSKQKADDESSQKSDGKHRRVATDDDQIETAGTAFLDAIGKTMGLNQGKGLGGEEKRVGSAHHRKTRSRCSIDWTLPPTDGLLEKDQQVEQLNRARIGVTGPQLVALSPIGPISGGSFPFDDVTDKNDSDKGTNPKNDHPLKRLQAKENEVKQKLRAVPLPDFADRISSMEDDEKPKRWWPYVYEIIIYQWVALLTEQTKQTKKGDKTAQKADSSLSTPSGLSPIVVKYLSVAAKASRGATIRCAPYLLEIIKQSLCWRVDSIFRERRGKKPSVDETSFEDAVSPLVALDDNIFSSLQKLITLLTDASLDSRNFDSFEFRKISIDVNDAVVRFIRDMFSVVDPSCVHKLAMVYFARFVTKQGKHWHDRDSKITGLRCSWETTKLRLNAVTLFVRFPEFMKINAPLMESLKAWPAGSSANSTRRFYTHVFDKINRLRLNEFTSGEGPMSKVDIPIPPMKSHWLAEICIDICIFATGHAEQNIQYRASSLLFELFWRHSQQGRANGNISVVASVFLPFLPKILSHVNYLSTLPAKGQIRKDILPCALFILQSAPVGLVKALWRKLAKKAEGKTQLADSDDRYGGIGGSGAGYKELNTGATRLSSVEVEMDDEPDIYDMLGLLNLALTTVEYEGNMMNQMEDSDEAENISDENPTWRREFLLSVDSRADNDRGRFSSVSTRGGNESRSTANQQSTQNSRRWYAHDCSMIIINVCRQIVRETLGMLRPSFNPSDQADEGDVGYPGVSGSRSMSDIFLQQTSLSHSYDENNSDDEDSTHKQESLQQRRIRERKLESLAFSVTDTIIFVRAVTSVYLHTLTMKQSDVAIAKTLTAAVEIVKIFGIKVFLTAVGETLQHWMRVTLEHCGARRADVRVEGSEFLNLLLRLTWEAYGSFFRIRLPLLAVQIEVMERIVAKSSTKYIIEQRRLGLDPVVMSNECAEASLTPLWRTIDRLHNQSASRNLSFKSALSRLAVLMKRLFKAYLAAHALAIVNRTQSGSDNVPKTNAYVQRMRVSVHRIVSNAAAFSKMFLGNQATSYLCSVQNEAVEDSFVKAADVYSSTELPSHRVAWLRKLAEFHRMRGRFAEEATCRCYIYHTYKEAAKQHEHIWSSSPYLPWASSSDGSHPDGEGVAEFEPDNASVASGRLGDRSTSFRKIFYRAVDSVRVRSGDWGVGGGGKYLFFGVTLKSEFDTVSPWYSFSEMEDNMVAEAEISGDLYLRAGIVESSRYAWSLATNFYSETFNYARLAYVYRRLAIVVTSQVPVIDTSNQLDMSSPIGRFYKVYFHGGAPDDLLHTQGSEGFIYRTPHSVQIKEFAATLENAVRSILPSKTTIDMQIDDGSPTVAQKTAFGKRSNAIGGAPIEPIKIKITPLRPVFKVEDSEKCFRGTPEWFQLKTEHYDDARDEDKKHNWKSLSLNHDRSISLSSTHSIGSVGSTATVSNRRSSYQSRYRHSRSQQNNGDDFDGLNTELIGVDKFYFTQPTRKDPTRGFRDWLKVPKGKIAERSLRVTELQVSNCFPACTTRQKIIHRAVFTQSPLEASVEAVSTWCSVLFRTITATNGQDVLAGQRQGLNAGAAKLVADCIHRSGVKQIGLTFLSLDVPDDSKSNQQDMFSSYQMLSEEEIEEVQIKLARMIVTFFELLHLLIARNRDVLLTVVQVRKRRARGDSSAASASGSLHGYASTPAKGGFMHTPSRRGRQSSGNSSTTPYYNNPGSATNHHNQNMMSGGSDRTDSAIGVQSELQRGFTNLLKALYPKLLDTINNEVPRWMRHCCQDKYFSSGAYRRAEIPIGDELFFNTDYSNDDVVHKSSDMSSIVPMSIIRGNQAHHRVNSPSNSIAGSIASERMIHRTNSSESEHVINVHHSRTPSIASERGSMNIHRRSPSLSSVL